MKSKVQYKVLDDIGERNFTVEQSITLPLLHASDGFEDTQKTFEIGKIYQGEPVIMEIMQMDNGIWIPMTPSGGQEGFMVVEENGVYLVPAPLVLVDVDNTSDNATEKRDSKTENMIEKVESKVENFNPDRDLGFSYKQLIVIAVIGLVVYQVMKK